MVDKFPHICNFLFMQSMVTLSVIIFLVTAPDLTQKLIRPGNRFADEIAADES